MSTAITICPANTAPALAAITRPARINWLDTAKGLGIILVVLGHVSRGLINGHIWMWTPTSLFIDGWIYAFQMPLFFFLSGLFLVHSTERRWFNFASEKLRTLAYPYFVWSVITLIIKASFWGITNHPDGLSELPLILYRPIEQYWFLYVLFVLLLSIAALLKLGFKPWAVLALAILTYPAMLPIPNDGSVVLVELNAYAIYVALGVVAGAHMDLRKISGIPAAGLGCVVLAGLIISSLGGVSDLPYRDALAPFLAVAGTFAIVALAVLVDTARLGAVVRFLGRHSLEIYVSHTIALAATRIALIKLAHVTALAPHLVLGTLAGLYLPVALVLIFDRIGFRYGFSLPAPRPTRASLDHTLRSTPA